MNSRLLEDLPSAGRRVVMTRFSRFALVAVLIVMFASYAAARQGRIVGTLTDSSSAGIPGVRVTATNNATNVKL